MLKNSGINFRNILSDMMSHSLSLFNRICISRGRRTIIAAAAKEIQETNNIPSYRAVDSYPYEHNESYLNKIYTIPPDTVALFQNEMPQTTVKQASIFRELGILIRKPAVEIISYLEQTDYTKPINKYILYGKQGTGKTTTLLHLLHYAITKKFVIVHLPWVCNWFRYAPDVENSVLQPDKLDIPKHAMTWLKYFQRLNSFSLPQYDLKVSKDYTWTQREVTSAGEPLSNLINFGIERIKFACGVVNALIAELKLASIAGKCRTLVIIDGFNAFTSKNTLIRDENRVYVTPDRISITSSFFDIVDYDWCNGAVILTVDKRANKDRREFDYPTYLLGKRGFEHLDPFLPVCVDDYTVKEFESIIKYYIDRKWLGNISPQGQKELELLSNRNPAELLNLCRGLY